MALKVSIVSREEEVWHGRATYVSAPSISGSVGILKGRQPLLAALMNGDVVVKNGNEEIFRVSVEEGFISVDSDRVIVGLDHTGAMKSVEDLSETVRERRTS